MTLFLAQEHLSVPSSSLDLHLIPCFNIIFRLQTLNVFYKQE